MDHFSSTSVVDLMFEHTKYLDLIMIVVDRKNRKDWQSAFTQKLNLTIHF